MTHHVTLDLSSLSITNKYQGNQTLLVGNGHGLTISHTGSGILPSPSKVFSLHNVLYVPTITKPLLVVHKFCTDNKCFFEFHDDHCCVKD